MVVFTRDARIVITRWFRLFVGAILLTAVTLSPVRPQTRIFKPSDRWLNLFGQSDSCRFIAHWYSDDFRLDLTVDGKTTSIDYLERVRVIVELDGPPLEQPSHSKIRFPVVAQQASRFEGHLQKMLLELSPDLRTRVTASMRRMFQTVFRGVSMDVSRVLIGKIAGLPEVKRVHLAAAIRPSLHESVPFNHVPEVWKKYRVKGKGVKVGVIDTGVDYMHSHLGGGIGAGFKVVGGYNFADDNSDPRDDIGHGTHVAGIIAASGDSLTGVATEASLLAVKVFSNAHPDAMEDDIIGALEYALDPNGDRNLDDRCDVVNMSLGGSGDENSPLSLAVDHAVRLGTMVVVSAGNNRNQFTIGSPGSSREALTVGACTKAGQLSSYSSHGPGQALFVLKPDLVAPGDSILSTYPKEGFEVFSGTSMASPHVAGVAALMRQLHPSWSPQKIKAVIMNTCDWVADQDYTKRGNGLVNALRAFDATNIIIPGSASFGLVESDSNSWVRTQTIQIHNIDTAANDYSVNLFSPNDLIPMTASPGTIHVAAGGVDSFKVQVNLNPSTLHANKQLSDYVCFIRVTSLRDVTVVPVGLFKVPHLTVSIPAREAPSTSFVLLGASADGTRIWTYAGSVNVQPELHIPLTDGEYIVAGLQTFIGTQTDTLAFFAKQVSIAGESQRLTVQVKDATHRVGVDLVDARGTDIKEDGVWYQFGVSAKQFRIPGMNWSSSINLIAIREASEKGRLVELLAGDMPTFYNYAIAESHGPDYDYYIADHSDKDSIFTDRRFKVNPSQYTFRGFQFGQNVRKQATHIALSGMPVSPKHWPMPDDENKVRLHFARTSNYRFADPWVYIIAYRSSNGQTKDPTPCFAGGPYTLLAIDSVWRVHGFQHDDVHFVTDHQIPFGFGPVSFSNEGVVQNGILKISAPTPFSLFFNPQNLDQDFIDTVTYALYKSTSLMYRGRFRTLDVFQSTDGWSFKIEDLNAVYTYVASVSTDVLGKPGFAKGVLSFNKNTYDSGSPFVRRFRLLDDLGNSIESVPPGKGLSVEFQLGVGQDLGGSHREGILSTNVYVQTSSNKNWEAQYVQKTDSISYRAVINPALASGLTGLKLVARDLAGNELQSIVAQGSGDGFSVDLPSGRESSIELVGNYPNPFNGSTSIQAKVAGPGLVVVQIYNVLAQIVRTIQQDNPRTGFVRIEWDGKSDQAMVLPSGVYFYRFQAGAFVETKRMLIIR